MSTGFSLAFTGKKQHRKVKVQEKVTDGNKEAVVGFGENGLQTAEPSQLTKGPLIIPKLENTYRTGVGKFKPSYIPESADQFDEEGIDKFETAAHDSAPKQEVTYGLQRREKQHQHTNGDGPPAPAAAAAPNAAAEASRPGGDAEQLKKDLSELPPEASLESYEAMPVERFGEALLRGMGWQEGRALGRNAKEDVVAKELVRRPQRLGLGATPAADMREKKYIKPGETRQKKDLVYTDAEGTVRSSKPVNEGLGERKKEGVHPGKVMVVVEGRHSGLRCEVVALEPKQEGRSDRARVRLLPSYETATVRCKELGEAGGGGGRDTGGGRSRGRAAEKEVGSLWVGREQTLMPWVKCVLCLWAADRDGGKGGDSEREKKSRGGSRGAAGLEARGAAHDDVEEGGVQETPWLVSNIRVKVVDKRMGGGRLYLKKGVVVDVSQPTVCDVYFPDIRESVQNLRQSQLETVVPASEGAPLLILLGTLRGRRGTLLKRNTATGLAAVQLRSDLSVHKLSLDNVAEYVGGMEDDY